MENVGAGVGMGPGAAALPELGWDAGRTEEWRAVVTCLPETASAVAEPGRVVRTDRGAAVVLAVSGPVRASWGAAVGAAAAADPAALPCTGDWVAVVRHADGRTTVEAVLERRTSVVRAQVAGSSTGQVLAANADVAAVVEPLVPDVDLGRVERLLALAWGSGADPLVVLTKADLAPDAPDIALEVAAVAPACSVLVVSAVTGAGLDALRQRLAAGATVALLGGSGAGKSTLLNALVGADVMAARGLRRDGKGRHTTVTRELHPVPGGGAVLDTPGLRAVGLAGEDGVADVFDDLLELAETCRFRDCAHRVEPGCAVLAAVEDGTLTERRLRSWRRLQREAERRAARTDARLRLARQAQWRAATRQGAARARP